MADGQFRKDASPFDDRGFVSYAEYEWMTRQRDAARSEVHYLRLQIAAMSKALVDYANLQRPAPMLVIGAEAARLRAILPVRGDLAAQAPDGALAPVPADTGLGQTLMALRAAKR